MAVPFSPETIGRHERGDVQMTPEDAVLYSERYGCQSLLLQYCADCPVGKMTGKAATERPLPFATLRVRRMLKEAIFPGVELFSCHDHQVVQTTANRIMEILPDGSLIDKITTYDDYLESDEMARKRTIYTKTLSDEEDN